MTTNDRDIRMMTEAALRLRDETYGCCKWDAEGTHVVFKAELLNHNLAETWRRVIGHATDPLAKNPGAIKRPFVPEPAAGGLRFPARAGAPDECRKHPGEHQGSCRSCATDGYQHPGDPEPSADTSAGRALLEGIRRRRGAATTTEGESA